MCVCVCVTVSISEGKLSTDRCVSPHQPAVSTTAETDSRGQWLSAFEQPPPSHAHTHTHIHREREREREK